MLLGATISDSADVEHCLAIFFLNPHPSTCLLILERDVGGRERERNTDVRETSTGCLSYVP